MVKTAAETFFYNLNESKFFLDESRYLRVPRKVRTIGTPPVDHLKIIDELHRGGEIYMTLYPQKPGTYFGAEICKCPWKRQCCREQAFEAVDVRNSFARKENGRYSRSSPEKVLRTEKSVTDEKKDHRKEERRIRKSRSSLGRDSDMRSEINNDVQTSSTASGFRASEYSRSSPKKVLRTEKSVTDKKKDHRKEERRRRKSRSSLGRDSDMRSENNNDVQTSSTASGFRANENKELIMRNSHASSDGAQHNEAQKTGRSVSRVTVPPIEGLPPDTQQNRNSNRRATTASQVQAKRRTTWGFDDMKRKKSSASQSLVEPQRPPTSPSLTPYQRREPEREPSPKEPNTDIQLEPQRPTSPIPSQRREPERDSSPKIQLEPQRPTSPIPSQRREPERDSSPKKSQPKSEEGLPLCYHCRKCTEKLCLKCRMPVDSCCCGIPNFLYCRECEGNIERSTRNVGDAFMCRKCDQKLCLVCRQHVDCCCCPKPNFFLCRTCETRKRTRCCIQIQR